MGRPERLVFDFGGSARHPRRLFCCSRIWRALGICPRRATKLREIWVTKGFYLRCLHLLESPVAEGRLDFCDNCGKRAHGDFQSAANRLA